MREEEIFSIGDFTRCVQFHGHTCPGLAIGFQAARILMKRLDVRRAPDEEMVAVVETDACGADAIQVMTGCTFGKGNFIFKNYGKHAFSLMNRKRTKAMRVCLRPGVLSLTRKISPLPKRFRVTRHRHRKQIASDNSNRIGSEKSLRLILSLYSRLKKPPQIFPPGPESWNLKFVISVGEPTKRDFLRNRNGKRLCIPCAEGCEM